MLGRIVYITLYGICSAVVQPSDTVHHTKLRNTNGTRESEYTVTFLSSPPLRPTRPTRHHRRGCVALLSLESRSTIMPPVSALARRLGVRRGVFVASLCLLASMSRVLPCLRHYRDSQPVPVFSASDAALVALPRIIHTLSCCTKNAREGILPFPLNFTLQTNPSWDFRKYNVEEGELYVNTNCARHAEAYRTLKPISFKSDLLRFCILYNEGGVWMDDDLLLLKPLSQLTERMDHGVLFSYDRSVYKLAGGPGQVWTAFIAAKPRAEIFSRAMRQISTNVARRRRFRHSLWYTGPALLYDVIRPTDSIQFRWRVQYREGLGVKSQRVADVETDDEVLLHFQQPRAVAHYSKMSRKGGVYN